MKNAFQPDIPYSFIHFASKYFIFCLSAGNAHSIHSPFLFQLYTRVIKRKVKDRREFIFNEEKGGVSREGKASPRQLVKRHSAGIRKGKLLYKLVNHFKPGNLLELGTNLGVSTAFLALGNSRGRLISLEGSGELAGIAGQNLDHCGFSTVEIMEGCFEQILPKVLGLLDHVDFVYFDGDHREMSTFEYFKLCSQHANDFSVFVFDDIHWSPGMEKAWGRICSDEKVSLSVDLFFTGLVFFRKELSKQHFCLRF
ncbi:MAG: class I SAM-dependent methyltransferase [Bacteroidetes bacterium]|nr:class I SAM-dependent methyltransferase [Bacteroidota bacterium]